MKVRAKFLCISKEDDEFGNLQLLMNAVVGEEGENKDFTDATTSGTVDMTISYESKAAQMFEVGKEYYLDFTEADIETIEANESPEEIVPDSKDASQPTEFKYVNGVKVKV